MNLLGKGLTLTSIIFLSCCYNGLRAQDLGSLKSKEAVNLQAESIFIEAAKARMLGDTKQEEQLLKTVLKEKPDAAAPHYYLAVIYIRQRRIELAEEHIKKAVNLDPENKWYKSQYAEVLTYQNKFADAAKVFEELAKTEKPNEEYLFKAAGLYQRSGKNELALELLDQLIRQMPHDDDMLVQKQQLLLKMNDLDGAINVAKQLIAQNPREARFYANLADIYDSNGQPEKAIEVFQKALKDFPEDPTIQFGMAEYYKKRNDTANYKAYIRKAILNQNFDNETQTGILLGYLQELSSDTTMREESIDITSQLVKQHPTNPQLLALYGEVLRVNGDMQGAAAQYKKSVALDPSKFNTWQSLLFMYTERQYADSLIKYSEQAMRYFPNQAMVHYLHGIGHFNKGAYTPAAKSVSRAVDLQPEDNRDLLSQMHATLGDIFNELKEYKLSDSSYERALRLDPDNATVLNNYAYYLSVRGERLGDAERMSKRSLELRPGEATFLDTYGWIRYKQGEYKDAKRYIEDALKANPDADGTLWEHLGDVYHKLGEVDKAVEHWQKAKEKGTDSEVLERKIKERKLYE